MKPHHIVVWLAKDGWHWHAVARNGRILSDSGEGYGRRGTALKYLEIVTDAKRRGIPVWCTGASGEQVELTY